jgi:alkylated DNA nucleotide flippase Atl1
VSYDNRTPADREKLDAAVTAALEERGQTRGDIATALGNGATPRMVSRALMRLVASGTCKRTGSRNAPRYSRA